MVSPDWWDPSNPAVGANRYAYAGNNPSNYFDVGGHFVPALLGLICVGGGCEGGGAAIVAGGLALATMLGITVLESRKTESGVPSISQGGGGQLPTPNGEPPPGNNGGTAALAGKLVGSAVGQGISGIGKPAGWRPGDQIHHIIPENRKNNDLLLKLQYDIESTENKMALPSQYSLDDIRTVHNGRHSASYGLEWDQKLAQIEALLDTGAIDASRALSMIRDAQDEVRGELNIGVRDLNRRSIEAREFRASGWDPAVDPSPSIR